MQSPLTTIHTPKEQLGIAAANCLLTRIRAPKTPCVFSQYSTELIIRSPLTYNNKSF